MGQFFKMKIIYAQEMELIIRLSDPFVYSDPVGCKRIYRRRKYPNYEFAGAFFPAEIVELI